MGHFGTVVLRSPSPPLSNVIDVWRPLGQRPTASGRSLAPVSPPSVEAPQAPPSGDPMTTQATVAPPTDVPSTLPVRRALTSIAAVGAGVCIPVGHWFTVNPGLPAATYLRELSAHQTAG